VVSERLPIVRDTDAGHLRMRRLSIRPPVNFRYASLLRARRERLRSRRATCKLDEVAPL